MKILGCIVDDKGIWMDPNKVDNVLAWKLPTSHKLLWGFLGSVGYLADNIATICIPMGMITLLTGTEVPFQWGFTYQQAFEEIKRLIHDHREHY